MVEKIRPKTKIVHRQNDDGCRTWYEIAYFCPKCGKSIFAYGREDACDQCGTFYDWGKEEPSIVVHRTVEW